MQLLHIFDYLNHCDKIKSELHLNRYKKLISSYSEQKIVKSKIHKGSIERHHILPKTLFPAFEKEKWNIINLPVKAHYIAHYLLFKSIDHNGLIYAFNQMRRITKSTKPNCRLYKIVKESFAKIVSENNKGKTCSEEVNKRHSELMKDTNVYRSPNKELKRFPVGQAPDSWVPFQLGRKRTNESKQLMSTLMSNRIWQYNEITKEVRFEKYLLDGFIAEFPPWLTASGLVAKDTVWIHHAVTKKNNRIKFDQPLPNNYVYGRYYLDNKGFDRINNSDELRVLDLVEKKYCLVKKTMMLNPRYVKHGSPIDKIFLFKYNNTVYTSMSDFIYANKHIRRLPSSPKLLSMKVPKPHFNQLPEVNEFCKLHYGKTYESIGIQVIPLSDYNFQEQEIYVRYSTP